MSKNVLTSDRFVCHNGMTIVAYRNADVGDVDAIVKVHREAFRGFFLTSLGPSFLSEYYQCALRHTGTISVIAEGPSGHVVGFVIGYEDVSRFHRELLKRCWYILRACAWVIVTRPDLWVRLVRALMRVSANPGPDAQDFACELASIGVLPSARGAGIGRGLVDQFIARASDRGEAAVRLTTDARDNEGVNAFYRSLGFNRVRIIDQGGGRTMNEYMLSLQ